MCGSDEEKSAVRGKYAAYEGPYFRRLRDAPREIKSFSADLTPETLNSHVYLVAPPQKPPVMQPSSEAVAGKPEGEIDSV